MKLWLGGPEDAPPASAEIGDEWQLSTDWGLARFRLEERGWVLVRMVRKDDPWGWDPLGE